MKRREFLEYGTYIGATAAMTLLPLALNMVLPNDNRSTRNPSESEENFLDSLKSQLQPGKQVNLVSVDLNVSSSAQRLYEYRSTQMPRSPKYALRQADLAYTGVREVVRNSILVIKPDISKEWIVYQSDRYKRFVAVENLPTYIRQVNPQTGILGPLSYYRTAIIHSAHIAEPGNLSSVYYQDDSGNPALMMQSTVITP